MKFLNKAARFLLIIIFVVIIDSFLFERYYTAFPEIDYYNPKIPSEFDGYRIAVISDLHYGSLDPEFWIRWVLERTMKENPDLIVGVGDYVKKSRHDEELLAVWPLINNLRAKDGVLLVNGNHDHWANDKLTRHLLRDSGKSIENKSKWIRKSNAKILIAGLGDLWENPTNPDSVLNTSTENSFRIVIAHNPDSSNLKHKQKVDLYLTGHTHGGQVRIPIFDYSPILPVKNSNFDKGMKKNRYKEDVFISAGIGWSILPIRFFCRSEVPIITLRSIQGTE
jgi:uncharacterized protein